MSGDDSVFESIYCNTCNDTLVDPFFGDPCPDCQSEPIERKERLLQLLFANKSLFGQMIAEIEANSVTTDELKNLKAHGLIDTEDRKDIYSDKRVYHQSKIINDYRENPSRLRH